VRQQLHELRSSLHKYIYLDPECLLHKQIYMFNIATA
jgi:hypothetical protein